jgi:hypothetical protein
MARAMSSVRTPLAYGRGCGPLPLGPVGSGGSGAASKDTRAQYDAEQEGVVAHPTVHVEIPVQIDGHEVRRALARINVLRG